MQSTNQSKTGIRYGLAFGGLLVGYGIVFRYAGLDFKSAWTYLFYVILAAGSLLSMVALRSATGGLAFQAGLRTGSLTAAIGGGIYSLYVFVFNRFVDDSLLVALAEHYRTTLAASGVEGARLERVMRVVETVTEPGIFAAVVFAQMLAVGLAVTLVAALVLRRGPVAAPVSS